MGKPYLVESGACSYTHIRLSNCPYKAHYKSLLSLLHRDITFEKLVRAGYIQIGLRSMHNPLLVKSHDLLGFSCLPPNITRT